MKNSDMHSDTSSDEQINKNNEVEEVKRASGSATSQVGETQGDVRASTANTEINAIKTHLILKRSNFDRQWVLDKMQEIFHHLSCDYED